MSTKLKKKVSKKNKASWRKHIDIKDVEDFLEEQRQEERIGDFADKKDDELFTIDVHDIEKTPLTEKQKRKLKALKPPKYLSILENTSKVSDPIVQRNHVNLKKNGRNLLDEVINPRKPRDFLANRDRMNYYEKRDKKIAQNRSKVNKIFQNDLWEEHDVRDKLKEFKHDSISKDLALHHLKNTGRSLVKIHDTIRHKTSALKAFEVPHPGISYNPSLKDHQNLTEKVVQKEQKIIKQENHLKRVTTSMFSKVTEHERDFERLKELASELPIESDHDVLIKIEEKGESNDETYIAVNPPVVNKKKDKKSRRKQKEQKEISRGLQQKKFLKKQVTDIHRLNTLKKTVISEEEESNKLKKRRKLTAKKNKVNPKRLCKIKFEEPDIAINLAEDIAGNLRNIKPESSLLVDAFKNFQKRNILPTSVDVGTRKRRKIKRFTRSSHKETPQQPGNKIKI